tara:strand:- start:295 stop:588 length:294 start_codon:yes stop_codon:yes gene_type:complete
MSQMPGGPNLNEGPIESEPKEIDVNANRKGLDKIAIGSCREFDFCISYKDLLIFGAVVGGGFYVNRNYGVKWWQIIGVGLGGLILKNKLKPKLKAEN